MNLKLKKRKREQVITHPSKEVRTLDDIATDTSKLASTEALPFPSTTLVMIKKAINKALGKAYATIQALEHRVSTLEGTGAGEAKLHLLEDDDFEDERAETDEEDFKDVQIGKVVDEEREVQVATQRSMDDLIAQLVGASTSTHTSEVEEITTITAVFTATA
ncbi:hypothetical protein HAX54_038966 [Datura stramonium]|uniref:Uncharacterized protein n=1 Tax=Datura stramonium TaxID=4076 RepID=A0ABS8VNS7_DATST|nr:hypothetical protein [Datura stramonium]